MATEETVEEKYDVEESERESLHFVNKRILERAESVESEDDYIPGEESQFQTIIAKRSFRHGLVSVMLIFWACFMIPYDIDGPSIHGSYALDRDMFVASLTIWVIGHFACIISCILSLITLKFFKHNKYIQIIQLLLIMLSTFLQVVGSILYAYSFCINEDGDTDSSLWASCVSKCHGLYLLYNSGFIAYLGFIVFAEKYEGDVPVISAICDKRNFSDTEDQDATIKFSKNFRITYLR